MLIVRSSPGCGRFTGNARATGRCFSSCSWRCPITIIAIRSNAKSTHRYSTRNRFRRSLTIAVRGGIRFVGIRHRSLTAATRDSPGSGDRCRDGRFCFVAEAYKHWVSCSSARLCRSVRRTCSIALWRARMCCAASTGVSASTPPKWIGCTCRGSTRKPASDKTIQPVTRDVCEGEKCQ